MEKYQIIPRKFRPKQFSEVAGHSAIVQTLKNALQKERTGQAYLFCGARGCGKTTLARLLAKALNCESPSEEFEPCNSCQSCKEINSGSNLDLLEIDGASNRGIDDIRQINETVSYAPHHGRYKIYLIDEVHMLTKEAFNALLKTLEEPPKNVKFLFATTEPHKVPQTIISRCQRFNLTRIPEKELIGKLERIASTLEVEIETDALKQVALLSEGSLRDAESLLDQLISYGKTPITLADTREAFGLISTAHLEQLDDAILHNDAKAGAKIATDLYEAGQDLGVCIDALLEHFRTHFKGTSSPFAKNQLLTLLDTLIDWQKQMHRVPFKAIHLEMLLHSLIRSVHALSLDELVSRLFELEERLKQEKPKQKAPPPPKKVEAAPKPIKEKPIEKPPQEPIAAPQSKYDTLVRFAAVELEGTVNH